jgi:hypothetical protein
MVPSAVEIWKNRDSKLKLSDVQDASSQTAIERVQGKTPHETIAGAELIENIRRKHIDLTGFNPRFSCQPKPAV